MLADNVELVLTSGGRRLFFLACNLLWPCSLNETSDRVKWDLSVLFVYFGSSANRINLNFINWFRPKMCLSPLLNSLFNYVWQTGSQAYACKIQVTCLEGPEN